VGGNGAARAVFWQVIVQIVVLDAVFSIDSVITAVGMVRDLTIMMIAVTVAIAMMMLASKPLTGFVGRHPTVVILCLGFLLMIGFTLIVEGFGYPIPKGYLYAAMGFSVVIETFNQLGRRQITRRVSTANLRESTARAVLRLLGGGASPEASQEAAALISSLGSSPVFSSEERVMIDRVLRLNDRSARTLMVPRPAVVWLNTDDDIGVILDQIQASGHSRFPVARGDVDEVCGIVHSKDLLEQHRRNRLHRSDGRASRTALCQRNSAGVEAPR